MEYSTDRGFWFWLSKPEGCWSFWLPKWIYILLASTQQLAQGLSLDFFGFLIFIFAIYIVAYHLIKWKNGQMKEYVKKHKNESLKKPSSVGGILFQMLFIAVGLIVLISVFG